MKEQQLIDIMFTVRENESVRNLPREEFAEWVAHQLRECGFPTVPCGLSWGVLND